MNTHQPTPQEIGKYRIESVLGRGAMGVVYRALDTRLDRLVAVKTIRTELIDERREQDWLERFAREARAAARCSHPNIVAVYDYDVESGQPFIVMELVRGRQLSDFINEGVRFELGTVRHIIRQILAALACAHAAGLVHRDVKPANVILSEGHHVKVADFGVARIDDTTLTQTGAVIGTPQYMAPEQLLGEELDQRADLFSVGIILFELLTGERPFRGRSTTDLMLQITQGKPRTIRDVAPDLPDALGDIVNQALARVPENRFADARAFAMALEQALGHRPETPMAATMETLFAQTAFFEAPNEPESARIDDFAEAEQEIISKLEAELTRAMGPIARVMIRRAADRSTSLEEMYESLAAAIPSPEEAARFREHGRVLLTSSSRSTGSRSRRGSLPGSKAAITDDQIAAAKTALLPILGPIADILSRKTAKTADTLDGYWLQLADHIPDDTERADFLRQKPV